MLKVFEVPSFGLDTGSQSFHIDLFIIHGSNNNVIKFCYSFIALSIIRCLKSAKSRLLLFHVCQLTSVVIEINQLILSQLKNFTAVS